MSRLSFLLEKARENIDAAELLESNEYFDIASSRAYYAMFYLAEALLFSIGMAFSSHSAVIAAFGKEFVKTNRIAPRYHAYLINAFEARQLSDYAIEINITRERIERLISQAKEFYQVSKDIFDQGFEMHKTEQE